MITVGEVVTLLLQFFAAGLSVGIVAQLARTR